MDASKRASPALVMPTLAGAALGSGLAWAWAQPADSESQTTRNEGQ